MSIKLDNFTLTPDIRGCLCTDAKGDRIKEALNKSILDLSEHEKQKCDFCFSLKFNDLSSSNLAIHPCIAGTSDLIRGSLILSPISLV